jgi:predicted AAA+ superfamily ATPase
VSSVYTVVVARGGTTLETTDSAHIGQSNTRDKTLRVPCTHPAKNVVAQMWAAPTDLFGGEQVIVADNEARKKAARDYQRRNPGTSYTKARRQVSPTDRRPLIATLGADDRGKPVHVNLDEQATGGCGPNCLIAGWPGTGKTTLLAAMAASLLHGQRQGDVELN